MMIVALGVATEGVKVLLGLWGGFHENATVATALLSDLVERGLDPEQGMLFVLDGSKALASRALGVRRGPRSEMPMAQRKERHQRLPGARPPTDQGPAPQGVARADYGARARLHPARRRARPHASRRRGSLREGMNRRSR